MNNVENAIAFDTVEINKADLPHLYGFPWYKWARTFYESTNEQNFLCAANQISKSSTMIRKCIHWATEKSLWPGLWKNTPTQFWYFYPDKGTATREFKEKWVKEFLPKDKTCPIYGWKENLEYKKIHSIAFNSGVTIYFLSYQQQLSDIQSSSVYAMFCDEELPVNVYDEVNPRLIATEGYFHMVFTATLGQEFWRRVIEEKGSREELKDAFKVQVSMYDCLEYEDGSETPWTIARIKKEEAKCRTEAEKLRRIYGRFILSSNKLYNAFSLKKHTKARSWHRPGWKIYGGVYENAILLLSVNKTFDKAEIFDGFLNTDEDLSALGVYLKYRQLTKDLDVTYAYADRKKSKDFCKVAISGGSSFEPVKKPKDNGEKLINSLFESNMFNITNKRSLEPLLNQIQSVRRDHEELEGFAMVGALVTVLSHLPWNFSDIFNTKVKKKDPYKDMCERERHYKGIDRPDRNQLTYDLDFQEINEDHNYGDYEEETF